MTDLEAPGKTEANPLPQPEAGQVWTSPRPRVTPRKILRVEPRKYRTWVIIEGYGTLSLSEFYVWARRSGARPVELCCGS